MVLVPSFFNTFQVWIQDNFLKKTDFSEDLDISLEDDLLVGEVYMFHNNSNYEAFDTNRTKMNGNDKKNDETKDSQLQESALKEKKIEMRINQK